MRVLVEALAVKRGPHQQVGQKTEVAQRGCGCLLPLLVGTPGLGFGRPLRPAPYDLGGGPLGLRAGADVLLHGPAVETERVVVVVAARPAVSYLPGHGCASP